MNYRIEKKGPIQIVGVSTKEPMTMEDCFEKVPQFWSKVYEQGWIERLCPLMDGAEPQGFWGVRLRRRRLFRLLCSCRHQPACAGGTGLIHCASRNLGHL